MSSPMTLYVPPFLSLSLSLSRSVPVFVPFCLPAYLLPSLKRKFDLIAAQMARLVVVSNGLCLGGFSCVRIVCDVLPLSSRFWKKFSSRASSRMHSFPCDQASSGVLVSDDDIVISVLRFLEYMSPTTCPCLVVCLNSNCGGHNYLADSVESVGTSLLFSFCCLQ